jgi:hypothetical protein
MTLSARLCAPHQIDFGGTGPTCAAGQGRYVSHANKRYFTIKLVPAFDLPVTIMQ